MEKIKMILDCDPGHDDAIAIMLAKLADKIDLLGISVSSGNQTITKTSNNALNVAEYMNIDVPVAIGCNRPIIKDVEVCEKIHGESGLDGFIFPPHTKKFDKRSGVQLIIDLALANEHVTMVTTGPMTNLGLAIRLEPRILDHFDKIVLMGGSINQGNVTPAAEFNIYCDPEAAFICFNTKVPTYMVGLDVTRKVLATDKVIERMSKLNTKSSILFTDLMRVFSANQKKIFNLEGGPLHDPATIVSLIDDKCITFNKMNVEIDISKGSSYGRTNCDSTGYLGRDATTYVATEIDVNRYWDVIEENLKKY